MHDLLFADQGRLEDPHLWDRAQRLELDLDRFDDDRRSDAVTRACQARFQVRRPCRGRDDADAVRRRARCTRARSTRRRSRGSARVGVRDRLEPARQRAAAAVDREILAGAARRSSPSAVLTTVQRPPCPFAIASTIARPRPTPPAARVRAASTRAKRSKIRSSASGGTPQPSSCDLDRDPPAPFDARAQARSRRGSRVYLTAFSSSASSAARRRSGSTSRRPATSGPSRHARGATSDQRMNTSSRNGSRSISAARTKSGWSAVASTQQALDDRVDPRQLVERDFELGLAGSLRPDQLEVAARDRHRRPQLVRGVVDESLLALEHRAALLRATLGDPLRLDAPARVPHHRQEHRRHQRHLEQLTPELDSVERVERDRHGGQRPSRWRARSASRASATRGSRRASVRLIQTK